MHKDLFQSLDIPQGEDNSLSEEQFKEYAKELGLD